MVRTLVVWLVVSAAQAPTALAWHATGHMITAQIAYDDLTEDARAEVDRLVAVLAGFPPLRDHAVTASLWPDDLKLQGVEAFDHWHYMNQPIREGFEGEIPPSATENVLWAIDQAVTTLRGDGSDFAKALMLRLLLHLVGDIHQPLHCATRYSKALPSGDRGGNDFPLRGRYEQLHWLWDFGAGAFPALDEVSWRKPVRRHSDATKRAMPKDAVPHWKETDPRAWAEESFALARDVVYRGISPGSEPTPEYLVRAREVIRRRLAVGGYRLGALLNDIFAAGSEPATR